MFFKKRRFLCYLLTERGALISVPPPAATPCDRHLSERQSIPIPGPFAPGSLPFAAPLG